MNRDKIILQSFGYACKAAPTLNPPKEVDLAAKSAKVYDALCPVNPITGIRDNALSKFFNRHFTADEERVISEFLTQLPSGSAPRVLTDAELIALCPPRNAQDRVEIDNLRHHFEEVVNYYGLQDKISLDATAQSIEPEDSNAESEEPTDNN